MLEWTGGYVAEIAYTHGYYGELNPLRIKLAFLNAGYAFPNAGTACELGFGQGVSANVHAAASITQWCGTDFNPAQAGYAQELAAAAGAGARLYDQAFDEFCSRSDLPDFDFIALHGIWSWISDANRQVIIDFIRRKLKVGGVVYISYNTQPGWAAMVPLRNLLAEHAQLMAAPGEGIVPRIEGSLAFAQRVLDTGALYGRANPAIGHKLTHLKQQNRQYLAHEYFNQDWMPMSFSQLRKWLEEAKLTFACSAHFLDHINVINLTTEQQQLLDGVPDRMFRETVRDFIVNNQFRRDYWVRGARALSQAERAEALRGLRLVLTVPQEQVTMKVSGALGESNMHEGVYRPILAFFSDHRVRTIQELEQAVAPDGVNFEAIVQAVLILAAKAVLQVALDDSAIEAASASATRLNRKLCEQARYTDSVTALASPVVGGALNIGRIDKLFLLASASGSSSPEESARFVIQTLAISGTRLLKNGKLAETPEEEFNEAVRLAKTFDVSLLPLLTALRINC